MRPTLTLACLMAVLMSGCPQKVQQRIINKKERPISQLINPHASTINVLIIDGKRFEHVRGGERFYLPLSHANAVVFIADNSDYSVTYHVFELDTGKDIMIHAKDSVFGRTIGYEKSQDSIESESDGKLVLATRSGPNVIMKTLIELDLIHRTVAAEKTLFYDKAGNVIREHDDLP